MFSLTSKIAAPLAGAVLLIAAGGVTGASAGPTVGERFKTTSFADLTVQVDHRGHRHWKGGPGRHYQKLGPRQIRRSLRHRGFYRIRIIDRRGPMYIVRAVGWRGMPVRLVVDSRTAHIVRSRPLGQQFHWSYSW